MNFVVISAFIFDILKLALYIACAYLALSTHARYAQKPWLPALAGRRFAVLTLTTLVVVGIKVVEDVLSKESGPVDTALMWWIRQNVSPALLGFFGVVTLGGSAKFLVPATVVLCCLLLLMRRYREAVLLAATMASGWLLTYAVKSVVDRPRPDLWSASSSTWYWGSSFPSGHTLSTAAFSTALTLIAGRIWPRSLSAVLPLAVLWISLMGLSRLVLGVHWPTDVLAAVCLGAFLPLAISMFMGRYQRDSVNST
jgi:undecaprenyl-diphosphatase